jgi:hypothetical protein
MRRSFQLAMLVLFAGAASACKPDQVVKTEDIPTAGVRFINAVPDSAGAYGLDLRFVDIVESNAQFRITFRNNPVTAGGFTASAQTQFKAARAGSRHFVIFLDDSIASIATTKLKDTTVTLTAGKNYTAILWGEGRANTMRLTFFEDSPTDPGAGNVALRVINATGAAIDGRHYAQGGTAPATATWAAVPAYSASAFVTAPVGNYMFNIRGAGSATNTFADLLAIPGLAKDNPAPGIEATPGTTQAGSAVTLVVYPRSTPGSRVSQAAAFQVPAGSFMWDRRPNK